MALLVGDVEGVIVSFGVSEADSSRLTVGESVSRDVLVIDVESDTDRVELSSFVKLSLRLRESSSDNEREADCDFVTDGSLVSETVWESEISSLVDLLWEIVDVGDEVFVGSLVSLAVADHVRLSDLSGLSVGSERVAFGVPE